MQAIKRNGDLVKFEKDKIRNALFKAYKASGDDFDEKGLYVTVGKLTEDVVDAITKTYGSDNPVPIETIQDKVEIVLMRNEYFDVARHYILYREKRSRQRKNYYHPTLTYTTSSGEVVPLNLTKIQWVLESCSEGLEHIKVEHLVNEIVKGAYNGIDRKKLNILMTMVIRSHIEKEPNYTYLAARVLLREIQKEVEETLQGEGEAELFKKYIEFGIQKDRLTPKLREFDLEKLSSVISFNRDNLLTYLSIQTLYDRYLLHDNGKRFELPQFMFMRVAMGISLLEDNPTERAIEFYNILSQQDYMTSTPTLFNSGTLRSQLSSCFISTTPDDITGIFDTIKENALLSKWAGGLGNDWTSVRALNALIKGTNGESQGVIPFLKVVNDTTLAVNQGGKRRGSLCSYLETWHLDIEDFIDLRKETGDDRRRTHDMNTANWIPDLFMERVSEDKDWTLFSPDEVPELHDLYGKEFKEKYEYYEQQAKEGKLTLHRTVKAADLWRKMLNAIFETGHPWITFKDPCNLRSPQQHVGVVHSSNLCCIAADQRVVTDRGLLTIGELYELGGKNKVVGLDGIYDASEMLLPRPNAPMVEIQTFEGYTHKVTPDHKVWVKDVGWVEAQHLESGTKLLIQQIEGMWGNINNPGLSYLMGLIAGDGTYGKNSVCIDLWQESFKYVDAIEELVSELLKENDLLNTTSTNEPAFSFSNNKARLSSAPLARLLEKHGFTRETKLRVPELVWKGDRETVSAYLRGLYQADANISVGKDITTLCLSSTNKDLLKDIQILWANFGVRSSINKMRDKEVRLLPDGNGGLAEYTCQPMYRLLITSIKGCKIAEEVTRFGSQKDLDTAKTFLNNISKEGYKQKMWATFTGLKELPNEDAYCLTVDSDTHAWTVNGLITKNTEITLNTSEEETAVCNLGSINLVKHIDVANKKIDFLKLENTVTTAVRMLDNVIDNNYYASDKARNSSLKHRPVGLGIMGFQDALYILDIDYASDEAVEFADTLQEVISYYAIMASSYLAKERGTYESYQGSLWDQGILPIDSVKLLTEHRDSKYCMFNTETKLDWSLVRERVKSCGMRNSNVMAIAPTATISNICNVTQSIEPTFQNLFVKSNLSGEFTVINKYLVEDLRKLGMWDMAMLSDLKRYDGELTNIERIPEKLKRKYLTSFDIEPKWLIEAASRRQKWLDQSQSLNLYLKGASGHKLDIMYRMAWLQGLKTTYYLRALGASSVEKVSVDDTPVTKSKVEQLIEIPKKNVMEHPDELGCEACQ